MRPRACLWILAVAPMVVSCGDELVQRGGSGDAGVKLVGRDVTPPTRDGLPWPVLKSADGSSPSSPPQSPAAPPSTPPTSPSTPPTSPGPVSVLCHACTATADCGGPPDYCLVSATGERFCGKDCSSGKSCPDGYSCLTIQAQTTVMQCVPITKTCQNGSPATPSTPPAGSTGCGTLEEMRQYSVKSLNVIRAGRNPPLPPYAEDACLDGVADAGNAEWGAGGPAHGKFVRECITKVPGCACDWQQENMGYAAGTAPTSWQARIDGILKSMMAEEPYSGGHFQNIVSTKWKRVGVGITCTSSSLRMTNDFGP